MLDMRLKHRRDGDKDQCSELRAITAHRDINGNTGKAVRQVMHLKMRAKKLD